MSEAWDDADVILGHDDGGDDDDDDDEFELALDADWDDAEDDE